MGRTLAAAALMAVALLAMPPSSAGTGGETGSEPSDGPHWPKSAGLGNESRPERSFELLFTPEEMYKVMYVHHKETKKANLTVWNIGSLPGTANVGFTVIDRNGLDWKVSLSNRSILLLPNEMGKLLLTITGPSDGLPNIFMDINLSVTAGKDPETSRFMRVRTYLVVDYRIILECYDRVHSTWAGVPTYYSVSFIDNSDVIEFWDLTCSGPPGWKYEIEPSTINGAGWGDAANCTLTVTPPIDGMIDEVGVVTVTVRSRACPSIKDSVSTHTVISGCMGIELYCQDSEKSAHPGDTVEFGLFVSGYGNLAGEMEISLEVCSLSASCGAWLEKEMVVLAWGDTLRVGLRVSIPADAVPGTMIAVKARAYALLYPDFPFSYDTRVTVLVDRSPDLEVETDKSMQEVAPGETAAFGLIVRSFPESRFYSASLDIRDCPAGWSLAAWPPENGAIEGENITLFVKPGEKRVVALFLSAPANALAGDYLLRLRYCEPGANETFFEFKVRVVQVRSAAILPSTDKIPASPGQTVRFPFNLTNTGNGQDNLDFSIEGMSPGWNARVCDAANRTVRGVTLLPNETRAFFFEAAVPSRSDGLARVFSVTVSPSCGASGTARFTVDVRLPDLYKTGLSYRPKTIHLGDDVTINLTVHNEGPGDAAGVYVKFRDEEGFAGMAFIDRLPANSSRNVSFAWAAKHSSSLEFTVDPDDLIAETDEHNNRVLEQIRRGNPPPDPDLGEVLGWLAGGSLIAWISAGLAGMASRRRPGRKGFNRCH
jgi:uncharacterized membrane protein